VTLVLASTSAARRAMLAAAGVAHEAVAPNVDEAAVRDGMAAERAGPRAIADALAELKAVKVSRRLPGALVLGSDQVAATADGTVLEKPGSREEAAAQLRLLSAATHRLTSAAVIAFAGEPIWRVVDSAELAVRQLSDAFIAEYLDREWPAVGGCVGAYRIEAMGAQLFARISGSHFTILGLPLLPVLDYLRTRGMLTS
jgi:septum formation protein